MSIAIRFTAHEIVTGTGDSDADVDLVFETVPDDKYRKYTRVGYKDVDSAADKGIVLIDDGTNEHLQSEQASLTADLLYWDTFPIYCYGGDTLVVRFEASTDADALEAYATYFEGPLGDVQ